MIRLVIHALRGVARTLHVRRIAWSFRWKVMNRVGGSHQCYICRHRFRRFYPLHRGWKQMRSLAFGRQLSIVGSDIVNYGCPFCDSNDRERHLYLYFDRLKLWHTVQDSSVLHCAPEHNLSESIKGYGPKRYFMVDLYPKNGKIQRLNIMDIPYASGSFDLVICNHVLEHVADDSRALEEICRVLRPGGRAVLQTPFSTTLIRTLEDPGIATEGARLEAYGQEDHVRLYGMDLWDRIEASGLQLKRCRHDDVATGSEACYYGMNPKEDLILVEKPQ